MEEPQQEGRWSCFLTGADSAQSTRRSIVHPVGSGTKKSLSWAELL